MFSISATLLDDVFPMDLEPTSRLNCVFEVNAQQRVVAADKSHAGGATIAVHAGTAEESRPEIYDLFITLKWSDPKVLGLPLMCHYSAPPFDLQLLSYFVNIYHQEPVVVGSDFMVEFTLTNGTKEAHTLSLMLTQPRHVCAPAKQRRKPQKTSTLGKPNGTASPARKQRGDSSDAAAHSKSSHLKHSPSVRQLMRALQTPEASALGLGSGNFFTHTHTHTHTHCPARSCRILPPCRPRGRHC